MQPRFDDPSCLMILRDCLKIYIDENVKLNKALKNQQICLTTNT
jgi:hypothetical protein